MKWTVRFTFLLLAWLGAFGIAFAVVEWRDDDTAETSQLHPSPTPSVDPVECQAAVAFFEAIDAVLERARNPNENLREEWGKAAANMDDLCLLTRATPTPMAP